MRPARTGARLVSVVGPGQVVVENDTSTVKGVGIDAALGVPLG